MYSHLKQWVNNNVMNKNVDIYISTHDAFLEQPSSGDAHDQNIGKPNNSKVFGGK